MGFKAKEFKREKFNPRVAEVRVPELAEWFDGEPVWRVRGLDGNELGRCNDLAERNRRLITDIISGITSGNSEEAIEAVKDLVGLSGDVPQEIAKRVEYLVVGSVDPVCDLELAVKLNIAFHVQFRELTNRILALTGQGFEPGKQMPSGTGEISEPV